MPHCKLEAGSIHIYFKWAKNKKNYNKTSPWIFCSLPLCDGVCEHVQIPRHPHALYTLQMRRPFAHTYLLITQNDYLLFTVVWWSVRGHAEHVRFPTHPHALYIATPCSARAHLDHFQRLFTKMWASTKNERKAHSLSRTLTTIHTLIHTKRTHIHYHITKKNTHHTCIHIYLKSYPKHDDLQQIQVCAPSHLPPLCRNNATVEKKYKKL